MDETEANQKINLDRILTAVQGVWVTAVSNAEEVREMSKATGVGNACPAQKDFSFGVVTSVIYRPRLRQAQAQDFVCFQNDALY